jgi:hypothetical protein
MKKTLAFFAFLLLVTGCSAEQQPAAVSEEAPATVLLSPAPTNEPTTKSTISVPQGYPATIDGVLSPGEWDEALVINLANGDLLLMHAGGYLYLGIRSDRLGLGSICVNWHDEISILHSSAALGTATYVQSGSTWRKIRDFSWTNRSTSNSRQALAERQEHLERENWLASNGRMGDKNEMEYQVALTQDELILGVTYLMSPEYETTDYWPATLADGCRHFTPSPDGPPLTVTFKPETWTVIQVSEAA